MFESLRPPGAKPATGPQLSVSTSDGVIFAYGNYVFQLTGTCPLPLPIRRLVRAPPQARPIATAGPSGEPAARRSGPEFRTLHPGPVRSTVSTRKSRRPSRRSIWGARACGKYKTDKGILTLAIFNFPTPNLARDRFQEFQKIPGAVAKRAGPLVAITVDPPDADTAERVSVAREIRSQHHFESTRSGERYGRQDQVHPERIRFCGSADRALPGRRACCMPRSGSFRES